MFFFCGVLHFQTFYYYLPLNLGQKMTVSFGNCKISKLTDNYMALLEKNVCDVTKLLCTTALTNPTCKFGISHSQIMKWCLSAQTSCTHFRDPHDCTFWKCHSRAFVILNGQSQNRLVIDYQDVNGYVSACWKRRA